MFQKDLIPEQHLVEQGYTSAQLICTSERDYNIDLLDPVALNVRWQAKEGLGFDLSHFQINWKNKTIRCPQGKQSYLGKKNKDIYGKPVIYVEFRQSDCSACPVRSQCTLNAWLEGSPLAKTRQFHFALLAEPTI